MKILYICTFYHRAMVFRDSMNHLEKRGHKVIAFNAVAKGTKIDKKYASIMDEKVIHRECFNDYDRYFFSIKQKKIRKAIEKEIDLKEFDLLHSHTLFNGGWAVYKLHKKYGTPYVVSVRNTDLNVFLKIPIYKTKARKIIKDAGGVLFLSDAYKEKFLQRCFSQTEREAMLQKCEVIPNGLEAFWLENIYMGKKTIHSPLELLCVGKIDKNKNLGTTSVAVEKLNSEGIKTHLTVIGQILDENIKGVLQNQKDITLIPYMTKEELIQYYRKSDIFVMPSFNETFGRVYAEAMTQAVPVIYTRGQGFDGTFPEGTVGYSVVANDIQGIVDAIKKIQNNYIVLSENCRNNCTIFDWTEISKRLEYFYLSSVTGGK